MIYRFAGITLDTDRRALQRDGQTIPTEPQVFDLIAFLTQNAGRVVSKDELIDAVWQGRAISDATLSARINAARNAFGDNGKDQNVLRTHNRRGFELIGPVSFDQASTSPRPAALAQPARFVTSKDGTAIAYASTGQGPPLLRAGHFLTHLDMDQQSPIWGPYISRLSEGHTLIRYDQRGTGMSGTQMGDLSIENYTDDLLSVADACGLDRFPLVASSQGVPVAIHFATQHPDRITKMVLYGGFAKGRAIRDSTYRDEEAAAMQTMVRAGWGDPKSAFMTAFTSIFCPDASHDELENLVRIQLASASAENAAKIRQAIDQIDVSHLLKHVETPTLVIHAANDSVHPISQGRMLASGIPNAQLMQLESRNHIPLPSDPVFNDLVTATLQFVG